MSLGPATIPATMSDCLPVPGTHRARILCIEGDADVARSIKERLSHLPVEVLHAENGMQGYWLAISKSPALIITDLRMTNGHGGEILESIKANRQTRDIPVIVLTDQEYPGLERHVQRMGARHCFQKPMANDALLDAVAGALNLDQKG